MNLPTILVGLVVAALLGLAIRYLVRNGACAACEDKGACQAARKAGDASFSSACSSSSCNAKCPAASFDYDEWKAALTAQKTSI